MPAAKWTAEQKAEALRLYVEVGVGETARRTGIPDGTIASWANRAGVQSHATAKTAAMVEAAKVSLEQRKAQLADDLMGDVQRLRAQLFAPCTEQKVVVLSGGKDSPATWTVADVDHDQPTFAEQKAIMTTIAIAVDKVQILTGAATERIDHTGLPEERERAEERLATILSIAGKRAS